MNQSARPLFPDSPAPVRRLSGAAPWLILAAAFLSYADAFRLPFFFDDVHNILQNPSVGSCTSLWRAFFPERAVGISGRPFLHFTFVLNHLAGSYDTAGYHLLNVLLHAACALLLFGIMRRTLSLPAFAGRFGASAEALALWAALLWTVHPVQTEAVSYLTNRGEILASIAIAFSLYGLLRARASARPLGWHLAVWIVFFLGMGSKEIAAVAPVLAVIYDGIFLSEGYGKALRRSWKFLLGFAPGYMLLAWLLARGGTEAALGQTIAWWRYAFSQGQVILHYMRQIFWSTNLCLDWEWPPAGLWDGILPFLAVAALLGLTLYGLARRRPWAFLGAWFFVILAPSSSLLPLRKLACDYRVYLPLAAVTTAAALSIHALASPRLTSRPGLRRAGIVLLSLFILFLSGLSLARNRVFAGEISIWSDVSAKDPKNLRAYQNLGLALDRAGRSEEAIEVFRRGLALYPDSAELLANMGRACQGLGRLEEALKLYRRALSINFALPEVHLNLGNIQAQAGRYGVAALAYRQALAINPYYFKAWLNLGNAFLMMKRPLDAKACYQKALLLVPGEPEAAGNLQRATQAARIEAGALPR